MSGRSSATRASFSTIDASVTTWWRVMPSVSSRARHAGRQRRSNSAVIASTATRALVPTGKEYVSGKR